MRMGRVSIEICAKQSNLWSEKKSDYDEGFQKRVNPV